MGRFAEGTTVQAEKSRAEIERTLARYGANAFGYMTDGSRAVIQFRAHDRFVRFHIPLPEVSAFRFDRSSRRRGDAAMRTAHDQEIRRRWRALALAIKAKLEVVESEIATFEEEFAVHMVLPDGSSVGEWLMPQIEHAYETNEMPASLPLALPPGESA